MTKRLSHQDDLMDNVRLRYILTRNDPLVPPTQESLSVLRAGIFARIDESDAVRRMDTGYVPAALIHKGWMMHAAAFATILILAAGFIVGQMSSGVANKSLFASGSSLLAYADEPLWQSMAITDNSGDGLGDDDDTAE